MSDFTREEQAEIQMLTQLTNGMNPQGGRVAMPDRMEAAKRLREIMEARKAEVRRREETDREHGLKFEQQAHGQSMDQNRLMLEAELERRKLDQEDERIEVAKAEVIVRALEAAARNPELTQLTQVVSEMSYRLLGGEGVPALEDKSGGD
ncbi:hypothetical protein CMI37_18930 [Candidatus Pacearchaeota archaeon]|nr:hypothetical protein [Candidatus Pacearchaeota archaeon]|tara:strand:+ start:297 stop:746 length:450 start_codon:yes stop_codon:yes gene_type:complete